MFKQGVVAVALKLLLRDWRSGELRVLLFALVIAVAGTTAVSLVGHRLNRTMTQRAAEFLAADLVVGAHALLGPTWADHGRAAGLRVTSVVEFASVLVEGERLLLTGVKAVDAGYPLRGQLRISDGDPLHERSVEHGPPPGEAWVSSRVLTELAIAVGGTITVGEKPLKVSQVLTHEPDRRGDLFSFSPRVMINLGDLAATAVIRPGSNAHYFLLLAGEDSALAAVTSDFKKQLQPGQRLLDLHEDRPELGNALKRAERYLGLSSVVIVLIAGVAIAMSTGRYAERHFDLVAMLKCLGLSQRRVLLIFVLHLLAIALVGGAVGVVVGYAAQAGVLAALKPLLPRELAPPAWYAVGFGAAVGVLLLFGFAVPPILRMRRLSPLRVIRREMAPAPASALLVYGAALLCIGVLVWRYTGELRMTMLILGIGAAALVVLALLVVGLLALLRRCWGVLPRVWRFALQSLTRQPRLAISQILAFSLTLAAMQIAYLVRTDLIDEWRRQLPAEAPNHFALNLFDADLPSFKAFLQTANISASSYYPIVRGRLTQVNGIDAHQLAKRDSQGEAAINRDLSLTFADLPPADNRLTVGTWWQPGDRQGRVSVEVQLAESLGIRVGDVLRFDLAGQALEARVASLRTVRWDSMTPNFYMIFEPGSLDGFSSTYLTSFYLPASSKSLLSSLVRQFPAVTILEVDALLAQFQAILRQVSMAVEFVLLFALVAGMSVLFAAVRVSLDVRLKEDVMLRVFGASRALLNRAQLREFMAIGLLSGLLATAISETAAALLFARIFDLPASLHPSLWLWTSLSGAVVVGVFGYLGTRVVTTRGPMAMLRDF